MPEYLLFNDPHLSDRAPSACTETYLDDLFDLHREIGNLAHQRGSTAIICAGDWFHHKTPRSTSHRTVMRLIDIVHAWPCPAYVVPGNHDMQSDRLDSIDDSQPLGVVISSGAVRLLHGWRSGATNIYGVPWLQHFTPTTVAAALADWRQRLGDGRHGLVVTHAPLYPLGQELAFEHYPADAFAAAMGGRGSVYYGHVHEPHGIHTAGGVSFCNPGALSRGSLHEHNLTRPIQIAAWDSDTGQFTLLDLPHKPAGEVFNLTKAAQLRSARTETNQFLASVGTASIAVASIEAVKHEISTRTNLDQRVKTRACALLDEADQ